MRSPPQRARACSTWLLTLALACSNPGEPEPKPKPARQHVETSDDHAANASKPSERGACGHGGRPPALAPATVQTLSSIHVSGRSLRLLDQAPTITGRAPALRPLQRFTAEQLRGWRRPNRVDSEAPPALTFRSPELDPVLAQATELRITLRPGGAQQVSVLPVSAGGVLARDRAFRTSNFPLDADPSNAPVTLSIDVRDLIQRSWDSLATQGALQFVEISMEGGDTSSASLEQVDFLDALAPYTAAAGVQQVELEGVMRPSLFLHTKAAARFVVDLPADADALVLYLAGTSPRSRMRVELAFDGNTTTLFDAEATAQWSRTSISIAEWRGEKVNLSFSNPGNGVSFAGQPELVSKPGPRPPDLVFYLVDTLVASRLGAWGSPLKSQGVSPAIDRLASNGFTFGNATSAAPWTKPSVTSLLTGLDPTSHGVGARTFTDQLPESVPLLQERFAAAGYRTGSFSANPLASTLSGLQRGFDVTVLPRHFRGRLGPLHHPSAAQLHNTLLDWLAEQPEQPFMAYVHTLEVHEYKNAVFDWPRPGWMRYDHAIRAQDGVLASLLQALEERERDTVLVLVSDHGESFGDHGLHDHGTGLYQSQVHVPLIFFAPRYVPRATDNRLVSTLDVAPTLLDLFGLPPLPHASGSSLLDSAGRARPVYASREWYVWDRDTPPIFVALLPEGMKAMRGGGRDDAVYALTSDPCEEQALPWQGNAAAHALQIWIDELPARRGAFERQYGKVAKGVVHDQDMARLRALGYVH